MIGFSFNDIHSDQIGVYAIDVDRNVLPTRRRTDYLIPGLNGTVDYGGNTYENKLITLEVASVVGCHDSRDFRRHIREIAHWLTGEGRLIFDDEPNLMYRAKVYESINLGHFHEIDFDAPILNAGRMQVTFECHPFAESLEYNQIDEDVNSIGEVFKIDVDGTQNTCPIITITNDGNKPVKGIRLIRKGVIK